MTMALIVRDGKPSLVYVPEQRLLEWDEQPVIATKRLTKGKAHIWSKAVHAAFQRPVGMFVKLGARP